MDCQELKESIAKAPAKSREVLDRIFMYTTTGDKVKPDFAAHLEGAKSYQDFIEAMEAIDVKGITVTNVLGCGMQNGQRNYYRGTTVEMNLLPKVKAEIAVCAVPVDSVIDAARSALYTGNYGDGKMFIYDIENVIKIRTGEEGYNALHDSAEWEKA